MSDKDCGVFFYKKPEGFTVEELMSTIAEIVFITGRDYPVRKIKPKVSTGIRRVVVAVVFTGKNVRLICR